MIICLIIEHHDSVSLGYFGFEDDSRGGKSMGGDWLLSWIRHHRSHGSIEHVRLPFYTWHRRMKSAAAADSVIHRNGMSLVALYHLDLEFGCGPGKITCADAGFVHSRIIYVSIPLRGRTWSVHCFWGGVGGEMEKSCGCLVEESGTLGRCEEARL